MDTTICCPGCQSLLLLSHAPTARDLQCSRCGRVFACEVKAGTMPQQASTGEKADDALPIPFPGMAHPEPLQEWRATFAIWMLIASMMSLAFPYCMKLEQNELNQLEQKFAFGRARDFARIEEFQAFRQRCARHQKIHDWGMMVLVALNLVTVLSSLSWLVVASRQLRTLQVEGLSFSPGMAVASFFIPVLNLAWPYCVMQEIWRASDPQRTLHRLLWKAGPSSGLVKIWWGACITCIFGTCFCFPAMMDPLMGVTLCFFSISLPSIFVIRSITLRQRERFLRLYEDHD